MLGNKLTVFELDDSALDDVIIAYTEPHRYYHNYEHISTMLNYAVILTPPEVRELVDPLSLADAIIFHDAVYHIPPREESNEELSAHLAERILPDSLDVHAAIRATEHHFDGTLYNDPLTNLLLDLDLITFTFEYEKFKEVNENISKEYETVFTKEKTLAGRIEFLEGILLNKTLQYRILPNKEELEAIAYRNIAQYLTELKS